MSESSERETDTTETKAPASTESETAPASAQSSASSGHGDKSPDSSVESDPSWDEVTPPRHAPFPPSDPSQQWSASEVTVVKPPLVPEEPETPGPLLPPIISEPEVHGETSGTMAVLAGRFRSTPHGPPRETPRHIASTRAGIELGRPVFAVAAIGIICALGALVLSGTQAAIGVAVGASTATLNLWAFTRLGTAFLSRRGMRASWGVLAAFKLIGLFAAVSVLLKMEIADPAS